MKIDKECVWVNKCIKNIWWMSPTTGTATGRGNSEINKASKGPCSYRALYHSGKGEIIINYV